MLREVAPEVWCLDALQAVPGAHLPARMTVVRLPDGGLWLHSPVVLSDAHAAAIDALGPVRHLVAPNRFHHLNVGPALERWPEATTWLAPGLAAKRPDLREDHTLGESAPDAWAESFDQVQVQGAPMVNEVVFFHRPSGTVILTDLAFNVHHLDSMVMRGFFRLVGAYGRFIQSRTWPWVFISDRAAAAKSAHAVLEWPAQRVVMAHGDIVEADAAGQLRVALARMAAG